MSTSISRQIKALKRHEPVAYEIAEYCYWGLRPVFDSHKHRLNSFVADRRQARVVLMIHELLAQVYGKKRRLNKDELKCLRATSLNDA